MKYNIIVAYDLNRGIGREGLLPWKLSHDLKRFKEITIQNAVNCVIMGRKTWDSISPQRRPLSNRINIILSHSLKKESLPDPNIYVCASFDELKDLLCHLETTKHLEEVFFIGGKQIYEGLITHLFPINRYYLTQVLQKYDCDAFFPMIDLSDYVLIDSSIQIEEGVAARFQIYESAQINHHLLTINDEESKYLQCLKDVMSRGQYRNDRTQVGTLALFEGKQLVFDLSYSFPLITTKKVFFRGVAEELFFFFSGQTNVKILQDKGVHIWDGNSSREYLDSIGQSHRAVGDLGKFYGFQWRHWGAEYTDCHQDYTGQGLDQLEMIIDLIKHSPTSRRILISAWNPGDLKEMALPPCHIVYQFYVDTENKTLSCSMNARGLDLFLGCPFNIASTALFTALLAKTCDLTPHKVIMTLGDAHIYLNHIPQVLEQLSREPRPFPQLNIKTKKDKLEDYRFEDLELINYNPHGQLSAKMAI